MRHTHIRICNIDTCSVAFVCVCGAWVGEKLTCVWHSCVRVPREWFRNWCTLAFLYACGAWVVKKLMYLWHLCVRVAREYQQRWRNWCMFVSMYVCIFWLMYVCTYVRTYAKLASPSQQRQRIDTLQHTDEWVMAHIWINPSEWVLWHTSTSAEWTHFNTNE